MLFRICRQGVPKRWVVLLEERLYGWEEEVASNAVEVHIHHLRHKLDPELIRTVLGVGYMVLKHP